MIEVQNIKSTLSVKVEQSNDVEIWTSGITTKIQVPVDSDTKFYRFKMTE